MSIVDKVVAAVTSPESEEARMKARAKARAAAGPGIGLRWCSIIICRLSPPSQLSSLQRTPRVARGHSKSLRRF